MELLRVERHIVKLRREAMAGPGRRCLRRRFELLTSMPGIAQVSALQLLSEMTTVDKILSEDRYG